MSAARPYLRLVRKLSDEKREAPVQFELAADPSFSATDNILGLCTADSLNESVLNDLVTKIRPTHIVDLRTVPRFDFGSFSRSRAFALFANAGSGYLDINQGVQQTIEELIKSVIELNNLKEAKSLLVLVNASTDFERIGVSLTQELRKTTGKSWELLLCGPIEASAVKRQVVFISHANPEDNEFVTWLQAQLTRLGYETWSDLKGLKGGEILWDTIEKTIRQEAIRVIAVISKQSLAKPGVLDEISLAVSVERTQQLPGFVIPIRLDDVPYTEFRANIARKKILDFSGSWSAAITELTASLALDKVPRAATEEGLSLRAWWDRQKSTRVTIARVPEILVSNRFALQKTPVKLYAYSGVLDDLDSSLFNAIPLGDRWLSYLHKHELPGVIAQKLQQESIISATDLFSGDVSITSHMSSIDRRRLFHRMLNRCWDLFLLRRNLKLYMQTGRRAVPFIPDDLISKNTVTFRELDTQVSRRRLLVGFSQKRNLYWHLAPMGNFITTSETLLALKLRILFSEDGSTKWPSVDRMRLARRSFCKNWWNDRWLSLQLAFMSWLSDGKEQIDLLEGYDNSLILSATPKIYGSPISIVENGVAVGESEPKLSDDADDPDMEDSEESVESELDHGVNI